MKLPRDLSGRDLAKALGVLGYRFSRQVGSHMRFTTLGSILREVGTHHDKSKQELFKLLFGQ